MKQKLSYFLFYLNCIRINCFSFLYNFEKSKDGKKFYNYLLYIIRKERIFLSNLNSIEELNIDNIKNNIPREKWRIGCYIYDKHLNFIQPKFHETPKIILYKRKHEIENTFILAHEIGHHFAITKDKDFTEERANWYILELLKNYFDYKIMMKYSIEFTIYSGRFNYNIKEYINWLYNKNNYLKIHNNFIE